MKERNQITLLLAAFAFVLSLFCISCANGAESSNKEESHTYTITFNANDETENPATEKQTFTYSSRESVKLRKNTFTREGYTFQGWSASPASTSATYEDEEYVTFSTDKILYAVWKSNETTYAYTYTITFYGNGGTTADGETSTTQLVQGNTQTISVTLDKNSFTREGYTFLGWAYFKSSSKADLNDGATRNVSSNEQFYAIWKSDTYAYSYTITFEGNGGTTADGKTTTTQMAEGNTKTVEIKLDPNPFSKNGCIFVGWNKNPSSTKRMYDDQASYSTSYNDTLYAIWAEPENTVTLTLDANDGSGKTFTKAVASGDKFFFNDSNAAIYNTFTRDNYQLVAFSENADGTGIIYSHDWDSSKGKEYYIELTSDKTLYGVWKEFPHITFNANGGKARDNSTEARQYQQGKIDRSLYDWYFIPDNVESDAETETVALNENPFTREGYIFKGWSEDQNATSATYTDKENVAAFENTAPNFLTTNWNGKTLYAVWQKIPKITYNMNGGSNTSSFSEDSVTITTTIPTAKYSYYTFQGWSTSSTAATATYTGGSSYSGTSDITLYAVWKLGIIVSDMDISVARGKTETIAEFTLLKSETVALTISNVDDKLEYIATPASGSAINYGKLNSATTVSNELPAGTYTFTAKNNESIGSANTATVTLKGN